MNDTFMQKYVFEKLCDSKNWLPVDLKLPSFWDAYAYITLGGGNENGGGWNLSTHWERLI